MAKKRFGLLSILVVIALFALMSVLEMKRQTFSAQLSKLGFETGQIEDTVEAQGNEELAQQIIQEVRALIDIPADIEPTVATIVDVDALRARNPFYNKAENGDHLVVTTERAILYRSSEKKIIDVVPVQLEPAEPTEEGSTEE